MKKEKDPKQVYLERYLKICREIKTLEDDIEQIEAEATSMNAFASAATSSGMRASDKVGNAVVKLLDLRDRLAAEKEKEAEAKVQIRLAIYSLENVTLRIILRKKYINGLSVWQIAEEMHYSTRHVWRLHNKALDEIKIKDVIECHT